MFLFNQLTVLSIIYLLYTSEDEDLSLLYHPPPTFPFHQLSNRLGTIFSKINI